MDHSQPLTQLILLVSLGANGFYLGDRLVRWCRRQQGRLKTTSLAVFGLDALLFCVYVFSPPGTAFHLIVYAATCLNDAVLLACGSEWVRILPRPWGQGGAHEGA